MEILRSHSETVLYPESKQRRINTPIFMLLFLVCVQVWMFVDLSRADACYFERFVTVQSNGKKGRICIVRDANGGERELERGFYGLDGAQKGDPICKSPGSFDYRLLPPGSPLPTPEWFRFGHGDLWFPALVAGILSIVVLTTIFNMWRRFIFDHAAETVRLERPMPWGYHATMEHPMKWVRGCAITQKRARGILWILSLVGKSGQYEIGVFGTELEARQAAEDLEDVLPLVDEPEA